MAEGKVSSVDGTRISFDRSGQGPNVVVVSSALADRSDARRLTRHLAQRFTVTNYDRRGRGKSGDTPPYAVAREVEDIDALIDEAGGSASLFGSSSGAMLALDAANCLRGKVRRVVLFEPPLIIDDGRPPVPPDVKSTIEEHLEAGRRGDAVALFMRAALGMPGPAVTGMRLLPPIWRKMTKLAHTLPYDLAITAGAQVGAPLPSDRWTAITAPAGIIVGAKSEPFLHRGADALAKLLPDATTRTLDKANHSAVVAAPKRLASVVTEILQEA